MMIYEFPIKDKNNENKQVNIFMTPLTEEHVDNYQYKRWFYDPEITKYNSHGLFPYTKAMREELLQSIESGSRVAWALEEERSILFKDSGLKHNDLKEHDNKVFATHRNLVGTISLQRVSLIHRSAELAIVIGDKRYWGCGMATKAVKKALYHAFIVMGLNRVWTGTVITNEGMRKVCKKAGFLPEGLFRKAMWLDGKFVHVMNYAILKEFYRGRENEQ